MDCKAEIEADQDVLRRVVTMLLALADLADRLCNLPRPLRCLVLWILRPAERAAREFVADLTAGAEDMPRGHEIPKLLGGQDGPDNAIRLALSFRELAFALRNLSAQQRRFSRLWARRQDSESGSPGWLVPAPCHRPYRALREALQNWQRVGCAVPHRSDEGLARTHAPALFTLERLDTS